MKRYFVVREYSSHTARNTLWKVLSRGFRDERSAENWMDYIRTEEPKKVSGLTIDFFIVAREMEDEEVGR